jgi:carboxyl-terminal processing protease
MSTALGPARTHQKSLLSILAIGVLIGIAADRLALGTIPSGKPGLNLPLISEAWRLIQKFYVDRPAVDAGPITYGAIDGMVNALGDTGHSRFLSPGMVRTLKQLEQNRFEGIGVEVHLKDGHVVVIAPIQGSPAQKAGMRPGDIILKVNGVNITGMALDQVIERITGPVGSQVTLTILSQGSDRTGDITITRGRITIHDVSWQQIPDTQLAHVHITDFGKEAGEDLIRALRSVNKYKFRGLILDLRNNPGGLLQEAVISASQFLAGGNVLLEKNAEGKIHPIPVHSGGIEVNMPLVVLVNNGSASASEIVAGALQDAKRATIVGEATFGTGTVLSEFKLSDGSALLLAVEEWLTPGGHIIWHKGITPDVVISLPVGANPVFPEPEQNRPATQWREIPDKQLVQAIEILNR